MFRVVETFALVGCCLHVIMRAITNLSYLLSYLVLASAVLLPSPLRGIHRPTNTSSFLPAQSRHGGFAHITYLVPHTTTFIDLLVTHRPLRPMDVEVVLAAVEIQLTDHINQQGDGPLEDEDDPYEFGLPGCWCSTHSANKNSLRYGVLKDVIKGLQTLLVDQQRFFVAYWDVREGGEEGRRLGGGSLERQRPGDSSGSS